MIDILGLAGIQLLFKITCSEIKILEYFNLFTNKKSKKQNNALYDTSMSTCFILPQSPLHCFDPNHLQKIGRINCFNKFTKKK